MHFCLTKEYNQQGVKRQGTRESIYKSLLIRDYHVEYFYSLVLEKQREADIKKKKKSNKICKSYNQAHYQLQKMF